MSGKNPILLIQNNSNANQAVNLFNIRPNLYGNINAALIYQWDITAQNLNQLANLQLQVSTPGQTGFATLTAQINSSDATGIIAALNSLNVGYFYTTAVGAAIIINSANKIFTYGNLTINQQTFNWTTSGSLLWNKPLFSFNPGGMFSFDVRSSVLLSSSTVPNLTPFEVLPYNFASTLTFPSLQVGDSIETQIFGPLPGPYVIRLIVKQNGIQILDQTQTALSASFFFNYVLNAVYNFTATIS